MKLQVDLEVPDRVAKACVESMAPEIDEPNKSHVELYGTDHGIRIIVSADDFSSLRAALNTYLRWVITSVEVLN